MSRKSKKQETSADADKNQKESDVSSSGGKISLDSVLNIDGVGSLQEQLLRVFDQHESIDIDASKVESVDTTNLQLLVVLTREAAKEGKKISIKPSDNFLNCSNLLGVSGMLALAETD